MPTRIKNLIYFKLVRACWQLAGDKQRKMVLIYCLFFCGYSIDLAQPLLISKIVEAVASGGHFLPRMLFWCGMLFASTLVFWSFHWPSRMVERRLAFRLRARLTEQLYGGLTRLPWQWHQVHHSGDTLNRVTLAVQSIYTFADEQFIYMELFMRLFGSMAILLWIAPSVGLLLAVAIPIIVIILQRFDRTLIQLNTTQNRNEHYLAAGLVDYLGNIATVLTLRLQETSLGEIRRRLSAIFPTVKRYMKVNEQKWFIFRVLLRFVSAGGLFLYAWLNQNMATGVLVGVLVAIIQYLAQLDSATSRFGEYYQIMLRHMTNIDGVSEIQAAISALAAPTTLNKSYDWSTASLTGIRFRYEDRDHHLHHLEDVSVALARGRRIALVGTSGAGKSTLLRLMRGLHDPHAGALVIDGAAADFSKLAAVSTLVPQDAEIFESTIRYNITCGIEDESALQASIAAACFAPVLETLPQGLDTDIRERGVNLSGGQKQRLALARGLFAARDSSLLLLDEPTSSLDPATEALVYDRLFAARIDACIVASVHRLHLLNRFDYIYVMEDGRVVEEGNFAALLDARGQLNTLWQAQKKDAAETF